MPAKQEPVSVNWQTLFAVLPVVWIWAFYRIKKLRLGLLVVIGSAYGIPFCVGALVGLFGPGANLSAVGGEWWLVLIIVLKFVLPILFIRKWSKQWNEKFS